MTLMTWDNTQEEEESPKRSRADFMKDPVKCGLCSRTLMCPRNKDMDDFLHIKNIQCISSSDPICATACQSLGNAEHVNRIRRYVRR